MIFIQKPLLGGDSITERRDAATVAHLVLRTIATQVGNLICLLGERKIYDLVRGLKLTQGIFPGGSQTSVYDVEQIF